MAQNVTVAGASFSDVPSVSLPKTGGGTASFTDVSDTTATAADVAAGSYFYTAAGVRTEGTNSGGSLVIRDEPDSHGGTIRHITAGDVVQGTINITTNGTHDVAAYADANVSVSASPNLQSKSKTYTPTESQQTETITAGTGYDGLSSVGITVNPVSSTYVGSGITRRSSSDLTASGATITAPAGYYSAQATKTVTSGSATPAASISATGASVSTGTNTLTLSKAVSNTPQVSAGYVSSGTAGNSNISLTASVTTQAAQTIYPSGTDQTISSGRYLTGTQTIKGVTTSNLTAENIKNGVTVTVGDSADADRILSVTGTYEGGGSDRLVLLSTSSMGELETSSTSATSTGVTLSVTGIEDYDLLIVEASCPKTNGSHMATYSTIFLYNTANLTYRMGGAVANAKLNYQVLSDGTVTSHAATTAYGIYVTTCSVNYSGGVNEASIQMSMKYNASYTSTIDASYTANVYGVKIHELIGV